jgi:hypothetical protein
MLPAGNFPAEIAETRRRNTKILFQRAFVISICKLIVFSANLCDFCGLIVLFLRAYYYRLIL